MSSCFLVFIVFVYLVALCLIYLFYDHLLFFFFKQKTEYEMRISDWSSDVCSSDLEFDDNDGPSFTLDPSIPLSSENVSLRNSINQNFSAREGSLFQARLDSEYEFDGILTKLRGGLRYAKRDARFQQVRQTNTVGSIGFGNIGTPSEANARLISSLPLSPDFLGVIGVAPRLNGGQAFLGVNPAYLRSERGRNELRDLFGMTLQAPAYYPTQDIKATEATNDVH